MALLGNGSSSDLPNPFVGEPSTGELYAGDSPAQFGGGPRQPILPTSIAASSAVAFGRPLRTKGSLLGGTYEPPRVH